MCDIAFRYADRIVAGVFRFKDPAFGILGDAFDGLRAVGSGAEFREVRNADFAVAARGPMVFENDEVADPKCGLHGVAGNADDEAAGFC